MAINAFFAQADVLLSTALLSAATSGREVYRNLNGVEP